MNFLPLASIHKHERIRRTTTEHAVVELAKSIQDLGLMHPIVLRREAAEDGCSWNWFLVAGETRLRAMEMLHLEGAPFKCGSEIVPPGEVPYLSFDELPADVALEMELIENTQRTDISWQDRAAATARLHQLRVSQNPSHTSTETAKEMGLSPTSSTTYAVTRPMLVAEHLNDPAVRGAKSLSDAHRIVTRKLEREFAAMLGRTQEQVSSTLILLEGESATTMMSLEEGRFDIILTDPPYGQDAHLIDAEMVNQHEYKDDWQSVKGLFVRLARESYRVTKPQAHLYTFCNVRRFLELEEIFRSFGWWIWPRPLIWVKNNGHTSLIEYGPRYQYECILYAIKGDKTVVETGRPDVLTYPLVTSADRHPAEKPVDLYLDLLRRSTLPNCSEILDPFCGSGTIFEAAHRLGLRATGIEVDSYWTGRARERIAGLGNTIPEEDRG